MTRKICAFCNQIAPLTKEHLWPASLHKRLVSVNKQSGDCFWLARLQREIPSEPQIRDVCAQCNNIVLSDLDGYICKLFDKTLWRIVERHEKVLFSYNYHLLKRWLLKLCFNSARIHDAIDCEALKSQVPYILRNTDRIEKTTQLFAQLSFPEEIKECELYVESESQNLVTFKPDMNRVGHYFFQAPAGNKLLRAVHLRSFSFFIAFWPKKVMRSEKGKFEMAFKFRHLPSQITNLRPSG